MKKEAGKRKEHDRQADAWQVQQEQEDCRKQEAGRRMQTRLELLEEAGGWQQSYLVHGKSACWMSVGSLCTKA